MRAVPSCMGREIDGDRCASSGRDSTEPVLALQKRG